MPVLNIRILREGDGPLMPELADKVVTAEIECVVGIESGMSSGEPAIGMLVKLDDDHYFWAQTSYSLWKTASAAFHGAFDTDLRPDHPLTGSNGHGK